MMHSWRWTILPLIALLFAQLSPAGMCLIRCECAVVSSDAKAGRTAAAATEHTCCALAQASGTGAQWTMAEPNGQSDACVPCPGFSAAERPEKQASTIRARAASPKQTPPAALRAPGALPFLPSLAERALRPPGALGSLHVAIPTTVLRT